MNETILWAAFLTILALCGSAIDATFPHLQRLWQIWWRQHSSATELELHAEDGVVLEPKKLYDFYVLLEGQLASDGSFERYAQGELLYRCSPPLGNTMPVFWVMQSFLCIQIPGNQQRGLQAIVWDELAALAEILGGRWVVCSNDPQAELQLNFADFTHRGR